MSQLRRVMKRVNTEMGAARFLEAVAVTFQDVQARLTQGGMDQRFRSEPSYLDFRQALEAALKECGHPISVLVIGCGRGVAGEEAAFAASVVQDIFDASELTCLEEYNLTFESLEHGLADGMAPSTESYDLIVAHSVLHYVHHLAPVFWFIQSALKHSGGLVLSHEPNALFWQTMACQDAIQKLQEERKKRRKLRYLRPANYLARLGAKNTASGNILTALNHELRARFGFQDDLTELEMRRIVDIHRPAAAPGDFKIGLDGFDLETLVPAYLPGIRLQWAATSGHLGYNETARLSGYWRRREQELHRLHPMSGCLFTGYWRRQ